MQEISEQEMDKIKEAVLQGAGVDLATFKAPFLARRINARMMATGVKSGSEYALLLEEDPLEPLTFYNSLSINVTECFRDPKVWEVFMDDIIPKLENQSPNGETIKVWSAGCATGQEPYSLSMMLYDKLGSRKKFHITGTDMNKVSIAIGKSGKYEPKSLKNIPRSILPKYVKKLEQGLYQVHPGLKPFVDFQIGDIGSFKIDSLDLVVCRNLLIYYSRPAQELLFQKFHTALKDNAYLILGMDESMIGTIGLKLFKAIHPRQRIFQKIPYT